MLKKFVVMFLFFSTTLGVQAFEDCIVTSNGKLTHINIENNQIINVFPLITVMNDKNTLIVHPLKEGFTAFSVLKDEKERFMFNVIVKENETTIGEVEGFDIFPIDNPPEIPELDPPPGGDSWTN